LPISHPSNEGTREIGDGTPILQSNPQSQQLIVTNAQPHSQYQNASEGRSVSPPFPVEGVRQPATVPQPDSAHKHYQSSTDSHNEQSNPLDALGHPDSSDNTQQQRAQLYNSGLNPAISPIPDTQQVRPGTPPNKEGPLTQSTNNSQKQKKKIKKNTRASLKVASLNIRGRGPMGDNKWNHINQIMREHRLSVLAVQEAHLTQEHVDGIHTLFGKRLQVHFSQGPNVNAQGVAIVLNKELTNIKGVEQQIIIPGRAILVTLPWHSNLSLTILNVYAPNAPHENQAFWETLNLEWDRQGWPLPDIMLGDFNLVEDAIDRLPSHNDLHSAVTSLESLRGKFQIKDGWRVTNPDTKCFSFLQKSTGVQSRIDRIYATNNIIKTAADWTVVTTALNTDHKMVSVKVIDQKAPYFGRGRWTMPLHMLKDETLIQTCQNLGRKLEEKLDSGEVRSSTMNPQTHFQNFKNEIASQARARAKVTVPKINLQIQQLQKECTALLSRPDIDNNTETQSSVGIIEERIAQLENLRYRKARTATAAHDKLEGETISKYWSEVNKSKTPRDAIYALEKPNTLPVEYETKSKNMAELARDYHHNLLLAGLDTPPAVRETATLEVLASVNPGSTLPETDKETMGNRLSEQDILHALESSKNGTSTGVNGLPYELWKALNDRYKADTKADRPSFNIIKALTRVYNDIEEHGVVSTTNFAEGWMCPLYKKKDKRHISNYRPITILNSDYKIFTKALAIKLAKIVPNIIHENQAGFIQGRSIFDQVKLTKLIIDYAEAVDENGVIVSLDQEKAYDKITHDYLWRTLAIYNLPESFISTVRSLYENAETKVMVNGVLSSPFKVSRGVRQGDPMSCLLFDIAIEPLANMLRLSELQGFKIPGVRDKLITTLFADDTTVFLSEFDKFTDLEVILNKWCIASGARFNVNKTEVTPVGNNSYRKDVISSRCIHPSQEPLANDIHIAQDQEPVRVLGAWIGNHVDQTIVWSPILDRIKESLKRWNRSKPTLFGRRLIIQMIVGGMTQYLAKVQTMPKQIEDTLEKIIRDFIWDGKKASVNMDTLYLPIRQGGIKLLDLRARNQAIDIMWLKSYLDLGPNRPMWAFVADVLISENISKTSGKIASLAQINTYLQSWHPSLHSASKLSREIIQMMKTGQKFGVSFEAIKLSDLVKEQLPAWYHLGMDQQMSSLNNHKASKCLRENHSVKTVEDLVQNTRRERVTSSTQKHLNRSNCACQYCKHDRQVYACVAPNKCFLMAKRLLAQLQAKWHPDNHAAVDNLTHTPNRKLTNMAAHANNGSIVFNPSVTSHEDLSHNFRVFTSPDAKCVDPGY
jgi:exonuclease III